MSKTSAVLSREEMRNQYGSFYEESSKLSLDKRKVPNNLHKLIPYVEFWGISDDLIRENLVEKAPQTVLKNLSAVIEEYDDMLDEWLCGEEAESENPSKEYVAFSAMRMAADFI